MIIIIALRGGITTGDEEDGSIGEVAIQSVGRLASRSQNVGGIIEWL